MSPRFCMARRVARRPRKFTPLLAAGLALLSTLSAQAQTQPLSFFKNYFVTGDYMVRGQSLWRKGVNGKAIVDFAPLGVPTPGNPDVLPPNADILAAFLYIQTAEKAQGSGIDHTLIGGAPPPGASPTSGLVDLGPFLAPGDPTPGSGTFAKALVSWDAAMAPCWSINTPGSRRLQTYRTDVIRFLPIDPATGKQSLTRPLRLVVPDSGTLFSDDDESGRERSDVNGPRAVGATLVIVYRDPSKPLSGIVLYDGGVAKRSLTTMTQQLKGFYDALGAVGGSAAAKMTHIVGDGRPLLLERVAIGGQTFLNPYASVNGPKWDNPTFPVLLANGDQQVTVTVGPFGLISDCVQFSAMVMRTAVEDSDGDGLLDRWESSDVPLSDPNGRPLPNLKAMGADPMHKDMFVEIDFMTTGADSLVYGGQAKPPHHHLPSMSAIEMVGNAFKNAPVTNPDSTTGIRVHFDVGNNYQASEFVLKPSPSYQLLGGEAVDERITVCTRAPNDPPSVCQFSAYPGTVGWKTGLRFLKEDHFDHFDSNPLAPTNRRDTFRYVFAAHAVGIPKDPCLKKDANGVELDPPQADLSCSATSADFHVPVTNSGIGDFPGGDMMMTLGAFDNEVGVPVATEFMQAGTLLHELGHGLELTHYGAPTNPRGFNCNPPYLSSMNYLYQLRGLISDDPQDAGRAHIDFNTQIVLPGINELNVIDGAVAGTVQPSAGRLTYRPGWYAPKDTSNVKNFSNAATRHCDGSPLLRDAQGNLTEPAMVRVDAVSAEIANLDWNVDGDRDDTLVQDLNFDGLAETPLSPATNDWANIHLNQVGGRRNAGGFYIDAFGRKAVGPLSLDVGRGDIGRGDIGRGDIGRGDIGRGDIGRGDIGRGDIGRGDIGRGDIGRGDIGRGLFGGGDLDVGGVDEPVTELDLETARAVDGNTPTPSSGLVACLTSDGVCAPDGGSVPVLLQWEAPHFGRVVAYRIYRFPFVGDFVAPANLPGNPISVVVPGDAQSTPPTFYYDAAAPFGSKLAYFVRAEFEDESTSGISNFATVTTPFADDPAIAGTSALPVCGDQDSPGSEVDPFLTGASCAATNRWARSANLQLYQVPSAATGVVFDYVFKAGSFGNEFVVFKVDDATGAIGSAHPGDPGYLAAAFARARVVFPADATASVADVTLQTLPITGAVHGGDYLAFFIVQNSTFASLRSTNPTNGASGSPVGFFSINSLNPDAFDHLIAYRRSEGSTVELGWEDLTGGGDIDFDDTVVTVAPFFGPGGF